MKTTRANLAGVDSFTEKIEDFDYTTAKGIWNLNSTTQFRKRPIVVSNATFSYIGSFANIANTSSYSFNNIGIGSPGLIVLSVQAEPFGTTNPQLTGVSINGVSANLAIASTIGNLRQSLWYLEVSGATGIDVTVNFSNSSINRANLGVWRINNYSSPTPYFKDSATGADATRSLTTSTLIKNSVVIAGATEGAIASTSWSGVSENYDTTTSENNTTFSGASTQIGSAQSITISATFSNTGQNNALTVAAWS